MLCRRPPAAVERIRDLVRVFSDPLFGRILPVVLGELQRNPTFARVYAERVVHPRRRALVDLLTEARERAEGWLHRLGLETRMHNRTYELSAGQQQRVAVARALIPEPEIVIADEPIAEVDTENADIILEALWDVIRPNVPASRLVDGLPQLKLFNRLNVSTRISIVCPAPTGNSRATARSTVQYPGPSMLRAA